MNGFTLVLPSDTATPRRARHAVAQLFGDHDRCADLLLCVSEVVTNAVQHARSESILTVRREAELAVVEVHDSDPRLPVRQPRSDTAVSGRGLHILDQLALRWGIRPAEDGKTVWFEFDLRDHAG